jgi:hypothetical protein
VTDTIGCRRRSIDVGLALAAVAVTDAIGCRRRSIGFGLALAAVAVTDAIRCRFGGQSYYLLPLAFCMNLVCEPAT